jgi:hypothetical protein
MKSYYVHLKNKYPQAQIAAGAESLIVSHEGEILCAVVKDGGGSWRDAKSEYGARDEFSLAPIPKEARAHKLYKDGTVGRAEEYDVRIKKGRELAAKDGKVKSIKEIEDDAAAEEKAARDAEAEASK